MSAVHEQGTTQRSWRLATTPAADVYGMARIAPARHAAATGGPQLSPPAPEVLLQLLVHQRLDAVVGRVLLALVQLRQAGAGGAGSGG